MKKTLISSILAISAMFAQSQEPVNIKQSVLNETLPNVKSENIMNVLFTPIKAKLITGAFFNEDVRNVNTLLMVDNNDCKYLGEGVLSISTDRTYIKVNQKSCLINGNIVTKEVDGFVIDEKYVGVYTKPAFESSSFKATLNSGKDIEIVITRIFEPLEIKEIVTPLLEMKKNELSTNLKINK